MKPFDQNSRENDEAIEALAAAWLAERDDGLTPEKEMEFMRWRQASPRHEAAVARLENAWSALLELENFRPGAPAHPVRYLLAPVRRRTPALAPIIAWSAAAAAALALAGGIGWHLQSRRNAPAEIYATTADSYQRVTLEDGSVAELNASSEIQVHYTPADRRVQLVRGEAHFTVAKNKERPFWVQAGSVNVRAVGTAFDVRIARREIDVLVTEGKVTLAKNETGGEAGADSTPEPAKVAAGQRAVVDISNPEAAPVIENVSPAIISDALAWQGVHLVFAATPLSDVIGEFNRRNPVQIELGDSALGALPISGSFRPENVEGFIRLLAQGGDIVVDRPSANRIILRQAR
jgi:transmembrane sensor